MIGSAKRLQIVEMLQIALERAGLRRVGVFAVGFRDLHAELRGEAGEAALPAIDAADDGGFDDQRFPLARRADRAVGRVIARGGRLARGS